MTGHILTLNAGSSSLKTSLYPQGEGDKLLKGQVERIDTAPRLRLTWNGRTEERDLPPGGGHRGALQAILDTISEVLPTAQIVAVAHRIVHGGPTTATASGWTRC